MVIVLLLIPAAGLSIYMKQLTKLEIVNSFLHEAKKNASSVENLYVQADELRKRSAAFAMLSKTRDAKLIVLRELTQLFAQDIWIRSVRIDGDKVEIRGYADRASPLITKLENSQYFTDVKFSGRITKEKNKEKFTLFARLEKP